MITMSLFAVVEICHVKTEGMEENDSVVRDVFKE